jgi:hypothetical protein
MVFNFKDHLVACCLIALLQSCAQTNFTAAR